MKSTTCVAIGTLMLILNSCATVSMTGRKQFNIVPGFMINNAAKEHYSQYVRSKPSCTDHAKVAMVEQVCNNIISAATRYYQANGEANKLKNYQWEIKLIQDDEPNAFVIGPGKIVVNTGILPITTNEDGLAAVIGHEVGHALAKHGNERASQLILAKAGGAGLSLAIGGKSIQMQQDIQVAFGVVSNLALILPFSRKHELEADEMGLYLAAMAGYDPEEAPKVWERMAARFGNSKKVFLSTHPGHAQRIQQLRTLIPTAIEYTEKYRNE